LAQALRQVHAKIAPVATPPERTIFASMQRDPDRAVGERPGPSSAERTRSSSGDPIARASVVAEGGLEKVGDFLWHRLNRRPYLAVAVASGLGLAIASAVGVGELAIAAMAGYAMYQVVKNRVPPSQAVRDALNLEQELRV
jgi:hypothetical protein